MNIISDSHRLESPRGLSEASLVLYLNEELYLYNFLLHFRFSANFHQLALKYVLILCVLLVVLTGAAHVMCVGRIKGIIKKKKKWVEAYICAHMG